MKRPRLSRLFVWLVALVGLVTVPYFACDHERTALDPSRRAEAGGAFATLSDGVVAYELRGPEDGERVVFVHGASGPMSVWDPTFAAMASAGFRVLRYDLYGRGLSDRPAVAYDEALFQRQLGDLLAHVGWSTRDARIHVVGSSMGAIIAARFAASHADAVRRVCLIGPAGFPMEASPLARLMPVPGIGEWGITVFGDRMLVAHNRKYFVDPDAHPEAEASFRKQLEYKGYKRAILSTMRSMPMTDFSDGYRALAATKQPVLLLWGREDRTFPFANASRAKELMPGAELVAIDRAAHLPQVERADVVAQRIGAFVRAP